MSVTTDHGVALRVLHVSKTFSVYPRPSDRIVELITRRVRHRTIQALCDVSFTIKRGEVIGVIGRNGAGKSTLLKIIAGIMDCDHGTVEAYGSLASILELGTGFYPDYSGRENIYIGGACLGMTLDEIERKIESIIEFSELHDFIDLPIKTYSSGMQARLTFSTAISVDPEIMVVDEALATGDLAFVEKCIRRIERIIQSGRTVLLVSHNMNLITRLTKRAIWLDQGKLLADDASETVAKQYELSMYRQANDERAFSDEARLGDQKIRILNVRIEGQQVQDQVFLHGTDLIVHIEIEASIESETACFYLAVHRADGLCAWTATNYQHLDERYQPISTPFHIKPGRSCISLRIAQCPLNAGSYGLDVGIEPVSNIATVGDYHDYFPRCRKFSIVRQDSLVLNKMCDSPSTWSLRSR